MLQPRLTRFCAAIALLGLLVPGISPSYCQDQKPFEEPPLPEGAICRFGTTQFRHGDMIYALSLESKRIASLGDVVRFWDLETGKQAAPPVQSVRGPIGNSDGNFADIRLASDGKSVFTCCEMGFIKLWDISTGRCIETIARTRRGNLCRMAISRDERIIAASSLSGVSCIDRTKGTLDQFPDADNECPLDISTDGSTLVFPQGKQIIVFDTRARKTLGKVPVGFEERVSRIGFLPAADKKIVYILEKSSDSILILDLEQKQRPRIIAGDVSLLASVALSPDGKTIALAGFHGDISLRDWSTGKETGRLRTGVKYLGHFVYSPDGQSLIGANLDGAVKIWDKKTGRRRDTQKGHQGAVSSLAYSFDGKYLVSGSKDETVRLWELSSKKELKVFSEHNAEITCVSFSRKMKSRLVSAGMKGTVYIWDVESGKTRSGFQPPGRAGRVVALSGDERFLAVGADDKMCIFDVETRQLLKDIEEEREVTLVSFLSSKKVLYTTNRRIAVLDVETGKREKSTDASMGLWGAKPSVSSDAKMLAFATDDNIVLFDVTTHEAIKELALPRQFFTSALDLSADGKFVAAGNRTGMVIVLNIKNGTIEREFSGHSGRVTALAFSPDSTRLASASYDSTVMVWGLAKDGDVPK